MEGPERELIDRSQPVLTLRDGTTITCADNPEEWVRGLTRVAAAIGADLQVSLPLVTVEPARVAEPVAAR
ncbi:MAG: hypothetical protein ACRDN6_00710 [Gaiellaceae bacterium]